MYMNMEYSGTQVSNNKADLVCEPRGEAVKPTFFWIPTFSPLCSAPPHRSNGFPISLHCRVYC